MAKLILRYVRVVDNTSLESYLVAGDVYGVIEETCGDLFDFYRLDVNTPYQDGLWVRKGRCEDISFPNTKDCEHLYADNKVDLKATITFPYFKPTVERIICIPDENGHVVDLQRVQYISPLDEGCYSVTLVSGWEIKLTDKLYSREKLVGQWKGLQNKEVQNGK